MKYLILGQPSSGKSALAEELVLGISKEEERIYLATMIPFEEEGQKRIEKHRRLREGKHFLTIERSFGLEDISQQLPENFAQNGGLKQATILLECVSNLLANAIFEEGMSPEQATRECLRQIQTLSHKVKNLVLVSNEFDSNESEFDSATKAYVDAMHELNEELKKIVDENICGF